MRGTKSPGLTDFHPYMRVSAVFPSVIQQIERFQPRCDLFCNSLMDRRWNLERMLISALPKQHGCHFPRLCNRMVERPHQFLIVENRLDFSKRCATSMVQSQMTNSA